MSSSSKSRKSRSSSKSRKSRSTRRRSLARIATSPIRRKTYKITHYLIKAYTPSASFVVHDGTNYDAYDAKLQSILDCWHSGSSTNHIHSRLSSANRLTTFTTEEETILKRSVAL
jgi:hypothetical protein